MRVVVLTNEDATDASGTIADALADLLFVDDSPRDAATTAGAKDLLKQLQIGTVDRKRLTSNANSYFTPLALEDFRASLGPLGEPTSFTLKKSAQRGGFTAHAYEAVFSHQTLRIVVRSTADGLVEQYTVSAK